jgi:peptidoglycan hydrolase-like protein with peptidoglycan-binding domain
MKICLSSGHGSKVPGASGYVEEVPEARRVVEQLASDLRSLGVEAPTFHDNESTSVQQNLNTIIAWHDSHGPHDLDVSVHFNANEVTSSPVGVEVLWVTQEALAAEVSAAISNASGLKNRGPKYRSDLAFLNGCNEKSILIEVAFCDSSADVDLYQTSFGRICSAIAETLAGKAEVGPSPPEPEPEPEAYERPLLSEGKRGSEVALVQRCLAVRIDGHFGPRTEERVISYQITNHLGVDGAVGPQTWKQLKRDYELPEYPPPPLEEMSDRLLTLVSEAAAHSEIADYEWRDRGRAPIGYIKGMAFAFATLYRKLLLADPVARIISQHDTGDASRDVLAWYAEEFDKLGMDNSKPGANTLRHLLALQIGLGMRESSGQHCCGHDMSATNTSADTAEAGLFQMSFNAGNATTDVEKLLAEYSAMGECQQSALELFEEGVSCSSTDWSNYGSGMGMEYQALAKSCPQFAVESTALCLRYLRQHWGPINRHEVELKAEADDLLREVQELVDDSLETA